MKVIAIAMALIGATAQAELRIAFVPCLYTRVIDGDTFKCDTETIRLAGVDAPETFRARCGDERRRGFTAKLRLRQLLAEGVISIDRQKRPDRYGRTLARVFTRSGEIGDRLIAEGVARRWSGRREPWCLSKPRP